MVLYRGNEVLLIKCKKILMSEGGNTCYINGPSCDGCVAGYNGMCIIIVIGDDDKVGFKEYD